MSAAKEINASLFLFGQADGARSGPEWMSTIGCAKVSRQFGGRLVWNEAGNGVQSSWLATLIAVEITREAMASDQVVFD